MVKPFLTNLIRDWPGNDKTILRATYVVYTYELVHEVSYLMVLGPHDGRIFDVFGPNSGYPVPDRQEVFGEKGVAL